jgi:hypothetical protein
MLLLLFLLSQAFSAELCVMFQVELSFLVNISNTVLIWFRCLVLCVLNEVNVHEIYRVLLSTHSWPNCGVLMLGGL